MQQHSSRTPHRACLLAPCADPMQQHSSPRLTGHAWWPPQVAQALGPALPSAVVDACMQVLLRELRSEVGAALGFAALLVGLPGAVDHTFRAPPPPPRLQDAISQPIAAPALAGCPHHHHTQPARACRTPSTSRMRRSRWASSPTPSRPRPAVGCSSCWAAWPRYSSRRRRRGRATMRRERWRAWCWHSRAPCLWSKWCPRGCRPCRSRSDGGWW